MSKKTFSFEEAFKEDKNTFSFDEALEPSIGKQLLDTITPKPAGSVLEGTTLTPEELAEPATGPSLAEAAQDIRARIPAKGIEAADYGKLFGAGATRGTFAAPEAIERGTAGISRDTTFKPTEFLNYLSDPRKLTNDLSQAIRLPKIFEDDAAMGVVPEETVAKQRAAVDEVLTKGKIQSLRNLTDYGNRLSDRIADSVTPEMKLALADSQPTGNLIEAFETGDFSKISFGKDPSFSGLLGHTAQSVGTFAPALATRVLTKSPVVGGTFAFGQAGSEGVDEARKFVEKLTPEQLAKESPYFRNLIVLGYDPKTAKEMTIDKAADSAAYMQGLVGALGNEFTARLMTGKIGGALLANSRNKALQIVGGTATGMVEEGLQELAEGLATDLGINKAVVREMGADSFANLVLGALGGAGPGAVGGALRRPEDAAPAQESTLTDVRVPPTAAEGIDPELKARATMRLEQILLNAQETNKINVRDLNKLARELDIKPSKDVNDTKSAIYAAITQKEPAPVAAPEAPVAEAPVQPPVVQPPAAQPPVVAPAQQTPAAFEGQALSEEDIEAAPLEEAKFQLQELKDMVAQQGPDPVLSDRITQLEAVVKELEAQEAPVVPQATEVVEEEAPVEAPKAEDRLEGTVEDAIVGGQPEAKEAIKPFDMGENTEYRVFQGDKGWTAALFDKDANQIVTSRTWPFNTFPAAVGKQRAIEYAETEAKKAEPYLEPKTQAQINQERQAAQREAAAAAKPSKEEVAEKKMLDAIEDIKKTRGTANQFIAKYGKPMFDRANAEGYIENEANDQRLFSTLKLDELWSKYNKPEQYAEMMKRREAGEKERQAEQAKIAEEAKPAEAPREMDKLERDMGKEAYPFTEGEKAEETFDLMTPDGKFAVAQRVSDALLAGKSFDNIAAARMFIKGLIGRTVNPGTDLAKQSDEAIETGVVLAARAIVDERNSPEETYDKLVDLYDRQPNLAVRTSESIKEQAYSTPAPLAYIASQLAGIDKKTTVYEPTAGNGMLLIGADPKKVKANELNEDRVAMLKKVMPDAEVTQKNAINYQPELSDVVIANPPFGAIGEEVMVAGNKTREIDHAISYTALGRMPANGRAVLIVGGVRAKDDDGRREGYRSAQKRAFYANLYRDYNVVDHFTVAGDLYKKQGAAYPVDVIVINGKGQAERTLPAADLPKIYSSYEQLKEKLDEASRMESRPSRTARVDGGIPEARAGEPQGVGRGVVGEGDRVGVEGKRPTEGERPSVSEAGAAPSRGEPAGRQPSEEQPRPADELKRDDTQPGPVAEPSAGTEPVPGKPAKEPKPVELGGPSVVAGERVESRLKDRRGAETETATQVAYEPHSQASSVGTLVPKAMRDAIDESVQRIEDEMGNIDEYVAQAIDMDIDTLRSNFSAEQIDALALAIRNAEAGKGFIIGDQTGIGKGRVVAAMIKYALVNKKIPIFVTEKPNLYSDMIRDLDDIGMTKELALDTAKPKIFITNSSESIPYQLLRTDKNGEVTETNLIIKAPKSGKGLEDMMKEMMKNDSLGDFKVIFTTYSQLQTIKGNIPERGKFIKHFGAGNYMIFDESHNAGGASATRDSEEMSRSKFVRELVQDAFGTFFSSATYAKRPDVMDLYSSTDMSLAVDSPSELGDAIKYGGVPMQQIVATMLTRVGQYIRRERTFAGVAYDTQETKVDKQTAENMASAMRSVLAFSRAKDQVIKGIQKDFDKEGKVLTEAGGEKRTIQGANFGSVMHNLIDQMLLSLKAQDSVKHAIERLKNDEKVVITVSNTMGSFLQSYAEDMGIEVGGEVDLSFSDLYIRYLDKQRMVTIRGPEGKVLHRLTDEELGPTLTAQYEAVKKQIQESGFGSAPISPIDYIHNALRQAGYKTDEITGRTITLNYAGGTPVLQTRTANIKQRVGAVRGFNNGELDVLILNQAGSTGLSLHAADKFKDKRKRHMIIVQPEKNIDTHMQMLGRVHRTGQVIAPAYSQMMADIPAEMRPAAVLMKKMASLSANTTASRKSAVAAEGVVDFINEYGGQVVQEYLRDNPDVVEAIGGEKVVNLKEDATEGLEEDIRKFTGYIPILPISQQEEIYSDLIERYNELIERENSLGTNKLEAKALDLDAETLSVQPITEDKGDPSLFATPAVMEKVDVKRTVKPYSSQEVKEQVAESLDGKDKNDVAREQMADLRDRMREFAEKQIAKAREANADDVRIQGIKDTLNLNFGKIKSILETYKIGDEISIKDANGIYNYAVITDITNAKKTANPAAGSDWKMQVAMANGDAKALTLSFSQINTTYTLAQEYYVDYFNPETQSVERVKVMDIFDKGATVRREKRWMVTGNILAGFAQYPGQIVTYTKKDGTLGQGVLMSRQFDFEKAQKEAPVRVKSSEQAMRFFDEIGGVVGTDDNNMRIEKSGTKYYFITPKTKRQGGKYYLDDRLTQFTGMFISSGNSMRAVVYDRQKAEQAIQHLLSTDNKLLIKTGIERARALFAPKLSQEEINQQRQADKAREGGDFYNNFSNDIGEKSILNNIPVVREEVIKEYAELRKAGRRLLEQVAKYGSTVPLQRQLNQMLAQEQNLKKEIALTKPIKNTADDFMARATKALAAGEITPDVEAFIRRMYEKKPSLLEGLRLSIKENKTDGKAIGNFAPYKRMVTLWRNTAGVSDPATVRHEITHSLEQMMTPEAREAVITEWAKSLERAMRENIDPRSRDYFDAVLVFLGNPTKANFDAATNKLPSYKFYQYINPSEYWAVNAEKLMAAKLGTPWQRFVNGVKALIEGLKRFFGFNNTYAIHQALNAILKGDQIRSTKEMLVDYISDGKYATKFLNNIKDDQDLVDKYDMPEVPGHDPRSFKDMMIGSWDSLIEQAEDFYRSKDKFSQTIGKAWDKSTQIRIEGAWFGAGLDAADQKRYLNKVRTANNNAIASVAVRNFIHAAYIATDVLTKGKLQYNSMYGQFLATASDQSMGNVVKLQHDLRKKLGRQLGDQIFQGYAVAHRTREIQEAYINTSKQLEDLKDQLLNTFDPVEIEKIKAEIAETEIRKKNIRIAYEKAPAYLCVLDEKKPYITKDGHKIPNVKYSKDDLPILNDEAIDEFIAKDKDHPSLEVMLDNWRSVNHNMLDNLAFSGRISKREAEQYKKFKYYVPWNRIMDEEEPLFDGANMPSNNSGIKHFKAGRTERDIDNVVDSMIHNVVMMTRSSIRNFAINRVVQEYGERRMVKDAKTGEVKPGRLRVYSSTGIDETGVRLPTYIGGRRVVVKIPEHQIADAVLGMFIPTPDNAWIRALSAMSNILRRSITFSLYFQGEQVFKDAPTAAWISGVKSPFKVWGRTIPDFAASVISQADPETELFRSAGFGGFRAFHRNEKKERALELGLLEDKWYAKTLKFIDKFGDASDIAPRKAVYRQVLKETGDPALALLQASEIVDWNKHGKSRTALFLRSNVPFLQAWATTLDAFLQAAQGKGFKGKMQKEALKQFYLKTGLSFAAVGLMYAVAAASDDDYWELDDTTRARNLYIPYSKSMFGKHVLVPMNTTAAIFFKLLPELAYTYILSQGTKREIDKTRLGKMVFDAFTDTMLGPTPVPSAIKTTGEIALDRNFFTGGNITPKGLKDVEAAEQYNMNTSELGKFLSSLTGTDKKRLLNPIEADHVVRSTLGTVGASAMWASNEIFGGNRPASELRKNPLTGGFIGADVQRLNESLVYDLRDRTKVAYDTHKTLQGRDAQRAKEYLNENRAKIKAYERATEALRDVQEINREIRAVAESKTGTRESKREKINQLGEKKSRMLANVTIWRRDAGL